MSSHVFPKKVASIKKHSLPLPQSWEGVLSVKCISVPFSTPTMQTKLKAAMETKRNKGKNLNGIQMIFHLNSLT